MQRARVGDRASARPAAGAHGTEAGLLGRAGRDPGKVASAWALRAEGKNDEALAAMRAAADHEDQTEARGDPGTAHAAANSSVTC